MTQEAIKPVLLDALLSYNPETGVLVWKARDESWVDAKTIGQRSGSCITWNKKYAGKVAGSPCVNGYLKIEIKGRRYLIHRVIWALVTGAWPSDEIDHLNGARSDNRLSNLRHVTHALNCRNMPKSRLNTSGVTGVTFDPKVGVWRARVMTGKRMHSAGNHKTMADAERAVIALRAAIGGFTERHGSSPQIEGMLS